ncbi:MAG: hypothetical protein IK058_00725 [Bacteroidales bacterium]|nr:hypothetical protein [Bacteroidales bacterium]
MTRRGWILTGGLCLLASLVTLVVKCCPRTVPLEQCSEVYRRYADTPGVQASFIKNKQINDTLAVSMTLLTADNSDDFIQLLRDFGKTEENINYMMSFKPINGEERFTGMYSYETIDPSTNMVTVKNNVTAIVPSKLRMAIFHVEDDNQLETLLLSNIHKKFKIETK